MHAAGDTAEDREDNERVRAALAASCDADSCVARMVLSCRSVGVTSTVSLSIIFSTVLKTDIRFSAGVTTLFHN